MHASPHDEFVITFFLSFEGGMKWASSPLSWLSEEEMKDSREHFCVCEEDGRDECAKLTVVCWMDALYCM